MIIDQFKLPNFTWLGLLLICR